MRFCLIAKKIWGKFFFVRTFANFIVLWRVVRGEGFGEGLEVRLGKERETDKCKGRERESTERKF